MMVADARPLTRCGIDTVEIARVERLLRGTPHEDLLRIFSEEELSDAGDGPGWTGRLAARFAAKEACLKLFPRETALGLIGPADFALTRDAYGAPHVACSPRALELIARHGLRAIAVSLAHDRTSAVAVAVAEPALPRHPPPGGTPVRSASRVARPLRFGERPLEPGAACAWRSSKPHLITDMPEMTIASDGVDAEMLVRPRRWDIGFIRAFMLTCGVLSAVFDYLTRCSTFSMPIPSNSASGGSSNRCSRPQWWSSWSGTCHPFFRSRPGKRLQLATVGVMLVTFARDPRIRDRAVAAGAAAGH